MRVGVAPLPSKKFQQPLAGETGSWLGSDWWQLLAHMVSAHPATELPPQNSCWQLLQAQLAPRVGGHLLAIPGAAGSIPKGKGRGRRSSVVAGSPCSLWGWAVSISTHTRALLPSPAPFLCKTRENGDCASLQAHLGQQELNVGEVCCVQDPGFDLELPAEHLPITFPVSVAAAQFGGLGRWGVPPKCSFPPALHSLLGWAVGILPWQLCRWGLWLWVNTVMSSFLFSVQIVAFWVF